MGHQPLIVLPHLATLGIGFDANGVAMGDTKPVLDSNSSLSFFYGFSSWRTFTLSYFFLEI